MTGLVLVTGFEAFGGFATNPSAEIARALDGRMVAGRRVVGHVLPVVLDGQRQRIDALLDEVAPDFVVALGLDGTAAAIKLERVAVNRVDFSIPDNGGAMPRGELLSADGPATLPSTLALQPIGAALAEAGFPVDFSDSAGTYLCNATFYHLVDALGRRRHSVPCGFIHVPPATIIGVLRLIRAISLAIDVQSRAAWAT
jgi:pyroglutamyl-peptidase